MLLFPVPLRAQIPLQLSQREAAAMVVQSNPLVSAAHFEKASADKQLSRAWREYVPTVTANARYSYLNDDLALAVDPVSLPLGARPVTITVPPIRLLDRSTVRADISATMPIFTGFRIASGIRAAGHLAREAEAQDTLALQKSLTDMLVCYNQVLLTRMVVKARTDARATVDRHHREVLRLREQGFATQYDAIRGALALADAERALEEATNQEHLALQAFRKSLALPEESALVLTDTLAMAPADTEALAAWLAQAERERPELAAVAEKREAVRALSAAETGKMFPQIGAFARYELVDRSLTQLDPKWVVGLSASLTIFNGLKDLASSQAYDLQERRIQELERDVRSSIGLDVSKAFYDIQSAARNIRTTETAVALAAEALRMANLRFSTGTGTSLEVLDAQTALAANQTAHAASLFASRAAYLQLLRSTGRTTELLNGGM